MKLAVVNDIHAGKCLEHNGEVRASSHLVENRLSGFLQEINHQHSPDALINLGDLIRSVDKASDLENYNRLITKFEQIKSPVIHLLGNHELKRMSLEDVKNIWFEQSVSHDSFGVKNIGDFTLLWLGLELDSKDHRIRYLPENQLTWLSNQLKQINRPTILFTHCAIDDHNVEGNFFYEAMDNRQKDALFLENQDDVRKIISSSNNVIAVIQAHLHYFHVNKIGKIPYITCPAMADSICGLNSENNFPDIYTILSFEENRMTAKAYSGKYCFAGYEQSL